MGENAYGELELVFPTEEYREQVEEYLQEHIDNNEFELNGDGGLDTLKDFDKWLKKVNDDISEETIQGSEIPSTVFLGVRKIDNRVVGIIQIRHKLTERLYWNIGHIGDGVRPSERRKGYATEMIRLALGECKKLGINRVLMSCYKENIGSAKSIMKNGGILENEVTSEDGRIDQRYWISLKKRYANRYVGKKARKAEHKIISIENKDFVGDICYYNFIEVEKKKIVSDNICIMDNNYKWLEFYDYNSKVKLTAIYNEKNKIVEWYFDIAREIGKEDSIPYEDDLYLDVVVTEEGEVLLLDEDELKEAFDKREMTQQEYDNAYREAEELINKLRGNKHKLQEFTDKYLELIMEESI